MLLLCAILYIMNACVCVCVCNYMHISLENWVFVSQQLIASKLVIKLLRRPVISDDRKVLEPMATRPRAAVAVQT